MAIKRNRGGGAVETELGAAFLDQRLIHFGEFPGELGGVEVGELVAAGEGFGPADLQNRRQDPHQRISLADRACQ